MTIKLLGLGHFQLKEVGLKPLGKAVNSVLVSQQGAVIRREPLLVIRHDIPFRNARISTAVVPTV